MTKRILVVEDNELNLKLFCDLLKAHGFETLALADGRELMHQARQFQPHLIIMDIHLPHVSGLDLITALQADEELAPIPVMAVTAYAGKGDEDRIRAAGARTYVSKPISVMKFVEVVGDLLKTPMAG